MFANVSRSRLLPLSLPFRYFGAAALFQVAAWGMLLVSSGQLLAFEGGLGPVFAALHLLTLGVLAIWDRARAIRQGLCYSDPRLPELGLRSMLPPHLARAAAAEAGADLAEPAAYEAHRILLGVPHGGIDFRYGDAFPHEADMDQLGGVDFAKGCFVGQEVVSRIEHRGTARTRIVPVAFDGAAPEPGTPVSTGERTVGTLGSTAAGRGLAMLRLDRVAEALAAGQSLTAGGREMRLVKPAWARFSFPREAKAVE